MVLEEATVDGLGRLGFLHYSELKSNVSSDMSVVGISKFNTTMRATVTDRREPSSVKQNVINHVLGATILTQPGVLAKVLSLEPCVSNG